VQIRSISATKAELHSC